jgi:hypothetical protein
MDVKIERTLEEGVYPAILHKVDQKETIHGESLMWTFSVPSEDGAEVVGFSSMSPSTKAKAYTWAAAIMGEIDPKIGWGPEDVEDRACRIVLGIVEDSNGAEKNKVEKVLRASSKATRKTIDEEEEIPERDFRALIRQREENRPGYVAGEGMPDPVEY